MGHRLQRRALYCASTALIFTLAASTWAVPFYGAAHFSERWVLKAGASADSRNARATRPQRLAAARQLPRAVRFREVEGRGLLVAVWINGAGPFNFAVDTGAGATILSRWVADQARVTVSDKRSLMIGGLSATGTVASYEASIGRLAVGDEENALPTRGLAIVTERLAPGVDGVLDPTEAYWPLGFDLDMVRGEMTSFDPRLTPLRRGSNLLPEGTIVSWLTDGQSRRPFVMLEGGRPALLDTGSGFGLALTEEAARSLGIIPSDKRDRGDIRDLAGGRIPAHRISPTTIRVGTLVLRGIPTDLLSDARAGSPVLLGRDALRPFRLSFDPVSRLIKIVPVR
jgi:predicted aspartyl protease